MTNGFEERLQNGPIVVGDGGMGTLISGAVPRLRCPEEANLRAPETVVSLHVSFINAGADLIETNTFGANRRKLAAHFLEDELEKINSAGVEARPRGARDRRAATSSSPARSARSASTGISRRTSATRSSRSRRPRSQARGVDLFIVETFFELDELLAALEAVRERLVAARSWRC